VSSVLIPPVRQVDPRGQRVGAGVSAIVLIVSFVLDLPWLAVLVGGPISASRPRSARGSSCPAACGR